MMEGDEMKREMSLQSQERLDSLGALNLRVQRAEEAVSLAEQNAQKEPLGAKAELAQLVGLLDKLEGQVDGVITNDLSSGRNSARHYRKALHARIEAIRDHATELYTSLDQKECDASTDEDESTNDLQASDKTQEESVQDKESLEDENTKENAIPKEASTTQVDNQVNFIQAQPPKCTRRKKKVHTPDDVTELRRQLAELEHVKAHLLLKEERARRAAIARQNEDRRQKILQAQQRARPHYQSIYLLPRQHPTFHDHFYATTPAYRLYY